MPHNTGDSALPSHLPAAVLVFGWVRAAPGLKSVDLQVRTQRVSVGWILVHLLSIAVLVPLTYLLYPEGPTALPFFAVVALWILFGAAAVLAAGLAMMPWVLWRDAGLALGSTWLYAASVALLGVGAWQWSSASVGSDCRTHLRPGAAPPRAHHTDA